MGIKKAFADLGAALRKDWAEKMKQAEDDARGYALIEIDQERGTITRDREDVRDLAGVSAVVDVSGNINRRITLTRLVGGGIVGGLVFKKRQDDREMYLLIDGPDFQWVEPVDPSVVESARRHAAEITTAGRTAALLRRPQQ